MKPLKIFIQRFAKDDEGATAIEYGLIAALVSVAAIAAMIALGSALSAIFTGVADTISSYTP